MCGFAGEFLFDTAAQVDVAALKRRAANLHYRGPDARGSWNDRHVGLAHARLKLLDPENGGQPMTGAGGTVLSYNGEIYNNTELRAELTVRGCRFRTRSDTEVLLATYAVWGNQAWLRLNGMFAFALYDPRIDTLYIVRDRLGIKPAYYRVTGGGVEFASEPAAWDLVRTAQADVHPEGILHFLRFAQPVGGRQSIFADLQTLEPGTQLIVNRHGAQIERWFMPAPSIEIRPPDAPHVVRARLRHLLHLAVGRQMVADAPVGVFLSGGVDSAVIVGLLAQMNPRPPETFSIALNGDTAELDAASAVAGYWRCHHHRVTVSPEEYFAAMRELIALRNLPAAYPNEVLIYLLARRACGDVKAVLTGEGADELFGGYTRILTALEYYRTALEQDRIGNSAPMQLLRAEHPQLDCSSEARFLAGLYSWFSNAELAELLRSDFAAAFAAANHADPFAGVRRSLPQASDDNRLHLLLEYGHLPNLLARLDGATMAASLEGRVPYTDRDLVEYVTALPSGYKFAPFRTDKPLLRTTFEDVLPPEVRIRPKRAFDVALRQLFSAAPGRRALVEMKKDPAMLQVCNGDALDRLITRNLESGNLYQCWLLLSLSMWQNRNIL